MSVSRPQAARLKLRGPLLGLRRGLCLLALGAVVWLGGCGGKVEFDLNQTILEQRVIGNAAGGTLTSFLQTPVPFGLNVEQEAKARNAQGPIQTVALTGLGFQITASGTPPGGASSFEFVQSITIYVESTRPNSSLAKTPVASLNAPAGKTVSIVLSTQPSVNLLPYVTEGAHFTSSATGTVPTHDITYTGLFTVHVRTL